MTERPRREWRSLNGWRHAVGYLFLAATLGIVPQTTRAHDHTNDGAHQQEEEKHHHEGVTQAMNEAPHHDEMAQHMKWTAKRDRAAGDQARAAQIVTALQAALAKYQDYQVAIKDGFEPFHPEAEQPHYHFTSKWRGFKAAFRSNPAQPTSLLYKKTATGYELEGAMYTAPKHMREEALNTRVLLSVVQWHAHVNLCFPPKRDRAAADQTTFGFKGSIATKTDCDAAGGKFYSQVFGWRLHVYPFAPSPEQIWAHRTTLSYPSNPEARPTAFSSTNHFCPPISI